MKKQDKSGNGFSAVSQCYVSSSTMGQDGKMKTEKYFSKDASHKGKDGNTVCFYILSFKNKI